MSRRNASRYAAYAGSDFGDDDAMTCLQEAPAWSGASSRAQSYVDRIEGREDLHSKNPKDVRQKISGSVRVTDAAKGSRATMRESYVALEELPRLAPRSPQSAPIALPESLSTAAWADREPRAALASGIGLRDPQGYDDERLDDEALAAEDQLDSGYDSDSLVTVARPVSLELAPLEGAQDLSAPPAYVPPWDLYRDEAATRKRTSLDDVPHGHDAFTHGWPTPSFDASHNTRRPLDQAASAHLILPPPVSMMHSEEENFSSRGAGELTNGYEDLVEIAPDASRRSNDEAHHTYLAGVSTSFDRDPRSEDDDAPFADVAASIRRHPQGENDAPFADVAASIRRHPWDEDDAPFADVETRIGRHPWDDEDDAPFADVETRIGPAPSSGGRYSSSWRHHAGEMGPANVSLDHPCGVPMSNPLDAPSSALGASTPPRPIYDSNVSLPWMVPISTTSMSTSRSTEAPRFKAALSIIAATFITIVAIMAMVAGSRIALSANDDGAAPSVDMAPPELPTTALGAPPSVYQPGSPTGETDARVAPPPPAMTTSFDAPPAPTGIAPAEPHRVEERPPTHDDAHAKTATTPARSRSLPKAEGAPIPTTRDVAGATVPRNITPVTTRDKEVQDILEQLGQEQLRR